MKTTKPASQKSVAQIKTARSTLVRTAIRAGAKGAVAAYV